MYDFVAKARLEKARKAQLVNVNSKELLYF